MGDGGALAIIFFIFWAPPLSKLQEERGWSLLVAIMSSRTVLAGLLFTGGDACCHCKLVLF